MNCVGWYTIPINHGPVYPEKTWANYDIIIAYGA
jgi:hypothetical protein